MESSDRERQERAHREHGGVDAGSLVSVDTDSFDGVETDSPAPVEQGQLSETATSVRAHWRIDVVGRDDDSTAGSPEPTGEVMVLVRVRLRNPTPAAQRVNVQNTLDGPVLFPRRQGVPEAGWTRSGFVGVVDAESDRALGYACPAPIRTPPIALERADDRDIDARDDCGVDVRDGRDVDIGENREARPGAAAGSATPAAVVRAYGDATPPAAVVRDIVRSESERGEDETAPQARDEGEGLEEFGESASKSETVKTEANPTEPDRGDDPTPPPAVTAWLDEIENRIERAERLDSASVTSATATLAEMQGLEPALEDADRLPTEATQLRELAARATGLAERADAVDVSETALRRLA